MKAPLAGVLDRGSVPQFSWMVGYVVNVRWAQLQTGVGSPLIRPNPIDTAVKACLAFNAANPKQPPRGLRVRLQLTKPGDWPTTLGGPITVTDPADGASTAVGAFWTPPFISAYTDLQNKLAAAYDGVAEVREIGLAMMSFVYDEPFRRYSFPALEAKGWTEAIDRTTYPKMIAAHAAWKQTRQFLSFNPYARASGPDDEAFTESVMALFRKQYGSQAVLMNNSIRSTPQGALYDALYAAMKTAGPPLSFQTAGSSKIGDPVATLAWAAQQGAASVELPGGYGQWPSSELSTMQAALLKNWTAQNGPFTPHRRVGLPTRRAGAEERRASSDDDRRNADENHAGDRRGLAPAVTRQRSGVVDRRNPPGGTNAP